MYPCYSPLHF